MQSGFQLLPNDEAVELFRRAEKVFGKFTIDGINEGPTIPELEIGKDVKKDKKISHRKLQEQIAEIGKLQFYYSELEYPLPISSENRNLDVVWKRELDGVPTFAFEVEMSGNIEKAISRLKLAS